MPVQKDPSSRRSVSAETEVVGTPEEVWAAIATGPGISSWFVPSEVEEREGGQAVSHFSPDGTMDSVGTVTVWQPPHRYVVETNGGPGLIASEWTVETRSGGRCVVRVVHSWFASTDEWDTQFEQHERGWQSFFGILRLVMTHFRGQPCTAFQLMVTSAKSKADAWQDLVTPLGLADVETGARVRAPDGAPTLTAVVEHKGAADHPEELLIRIEEPAPGLAHMFAIPMAGAVYLSLRFFLFGAQAATEAPGLESEWRAWLSERFGEPGAPG